MQLRMGLRVRDSDVARSMEILAKAGVKVNGSHPLLEK